MRGWGGGGGIGERASNFVILLVRCLDLLLICSTICFIAFLAPTFGCDNVTSMHQTVQKGNPTAHEDSTLHVKHKYTHSFLLEGAKLPLQVDGKLKQRFYQTNNLLLLLLL